MTGIDRLSGSSPLAGTTAATSGDAKSLATNAVGEIGHRVLAWVDASARTTTAGTGAWSDATGRASSFTPDKSELHRGGDVYDVRGMARDIAGATGATPTQEGELHRALEDFARASVVQLAGLAGASGDRQIAGVRSALDVAAGTHAGSGVEGVVNRLQAATAHLSALNG